MELYRYLVDDFLIEYCRSLKPKDFTVKTENIARTKMGKREYLNNQLTRVLMSKLEAYFESTVEIPRIKIGKRQTVDTLIIEEAFLLAKILRGELKTWRPRVSIL